MTDLSQVAIHSAPTTIPVPASTPDPGDLSDKGRDQAGQDAWRQRVNKAAEKCFGAGWKLTLERYKRAVGAGQMEFSL